MPQLTSGAPMCRRRSAQYYSMPRTARGMLLCLRPSAQRTMVSRWTWLISTGRPAPMDPGKPGFRLLTVGGILALGLIVVVLPTKKPHRFGQARVALDQPG